MWNEFCCIFTVLNHEYSPVVFYNSHTQKKFKLIFDLFEFSGFERL